MSPSATETVPTTPAEMMRLIKRAEGGDSKAVPVLRKLLENPRMVEICGGDLAEQTERSLINAAAGDNLAFREALLQRMVQLRQELSGATPTVLEKLLVERVVTCWLHLHIGQIRFVQATDLSLRQSDCHQRALTHAHRRYLSAIKALAQIRKLAVPTVQVNIARKQVNLAGTPFNPLAERSAND